MARNQDHLIGKTKMLRSTSNPMIATITKAPKRFTLYAAGFALSAFVIALLVATFATGPAQAQSKTYPAPQPCGQGHAKVSDPPVDEITTGEIALFDAYWDLATETINNNLCPPKMVTKTVSDPLAGDTVTMARENANIDIAKTVIHVEDKHKVTVVAGTAGPGQISVDEYPFLREGIELDVNGNPENGTQVYWLRLDDPDTTDVDETSDLVLGFSTALFDDLYWETRGENKPFQYLYASERDDIVEVHGPHFFAFGAPKANDGAHQEAIWSSVDAHVNEMQMDAGEKFHAVQWVFTEPGTHHIQANINGQVRQEAGGTGGKWAGWEKIHPEEKTSSSQVRTYTIQSGPLNFNEQPMFQVERSVTENAPSSTNVGAPVAVTGGNDGDTLTYELSGKGNSHFSVAGTPGGDAQVTVAAGAMLDYETRPSYDLVLSVSDRKDPEGNVDDRVDSTVALRINLEDVTGDPGVTITATDTEPTVGEEVTFTVSSYSGDIPSAEHLTYLWTERDMKNLKPEVNATVLTSTTDSVSVTKNTAGEWRYQVHVSWSNSPGEVGSNKIIVTWGP